MAFHKLFENKYNEVPSSLQNLALRLTNKRPDETIKVRVEQGEHGLLRLISENLKDFVTREEMTEAINAAVSAACTEVTAEISAAITEAMGTLRTERATAISDAITTAINTHLEAEHTSTETPDDNTEPTA